MRLLNITIAVLSIFMAASANAKSIYRDLRKIQDDKRVLINPDKGWYHHYYDNQLGKYLGKEVDIMAIPNMHHLFLRFAWCYLEPKEGEFKWNLIDDIVEKYYPKGVKVSLSITCNETGTKYATPEWVRNAGAKGRITKTKTGKEIFEPYGDDPVFLEKLNNLHKAIAERYDGKPYIVDMTIASLGNWGEGHYSATSHITVPFDILKTHVELYLRNYKKSRITIGDDWIGNNLSDADELIKMREFLKKNKVSYRDDSILVRWHSSVHNAHTNSFFRPQFFDDAYTHSPSTIELEHYGATLKSGAWKGKEGAENGADMLYKAIKRSRCTYMGYHGYADSYLKDNPETVKKYANLVGYWYFINFAYFNPENNVLHLEWENRGIAHAFNKYELYVKIKNKADTSEHIFHIKKADNIKWEPNQICTDKYSIPTSKLPAGDYEFFVMLKKETPESEARPIELAFKEEQRTPDGYYKLFDFTK